MLFMHPFMPGAPKNPPTKNAPTAVEKEINPRCKLNKFVILDFSDLFRKANIEG